MDGNKKTIIQKRIDKTIENLQKNNMYAIYIENKADVVSKVSELLNDGDIVTVGGSTSLFECGVIDYLRCGKYNFLDRYAAGLTSTNIKSGVVADPIRDIYISAFTADAYFCSSNAVTENGELYNVDGNSNRVAAILYGPKSVIMIVGYNKIVKNIDEAILRVKQIAAPSNCTRLSSDTYCREKGECQSLLDNNSFLCDGCKSKGRICCNYVVSAYQRIKDRIKVIIVGEDIGF